MYDYTEILFLVGRVLFGGYFVMMGLNHFMKNGMLTGYARSKNVPMAKLAVMGSGLLLLAGGLGVLLGGYVQWAVAALALFLVPVSFTMHAFWAIPDPMARMGDQVNFMKNMALLGAALMLLTIPGPWPFSLFGY
ncbi:MAG: DoxX family protein [Candidatus Liptonbacteria bacterium RIFCSPLOWO2_12_FULL_60_15]|uniref:DoxX family protein n=1 Tax=Candidatus Liptonbacteria bacterium RIFCSPLOWO2_12_FULL_60_15 TaxID=1798653 RepID=A0A1G2CJT7_9BACT|nr:MAG: DoxX family protein [Candidatus Liptonbacteria bacterium RIFCSPLOWO2_12_FULL_60_15]